MFWSFILKNANKKGAVAQNKSFICSLQHVRTPVVSNHKFFGPYAMPDVYKLCLEYQIMDFYVNVSAAYMLKIFPVQ